MVISGNCARPHTRAGLAFLSGRVVMGFGGLLHYAVTAPAAHTAAMNITIVLEALGALPFLLVIVAAWRTTQPNDASNQID